MNTDHFLSVFSVKIGGLCWTSKVIYNPLQLFFSDP